MACIACARGVSAYIQNVRLREFELPYLIPGDLTSLFLIPGVIVFLPLCVSPGAILLQRVASIQVAPSILFS